MDRQHPYAQEIRKAVKDCTARGLYFSAKWASELLLSIPASRRAPKARDRSSTISMLSAAASESEELEAEEEDMLDCAKSMAEAKEYMRASKMLAESRSARGRFMKWYFDFLAEEKRALRDWHNLDYSLSQDTKPTQVTLQPPTPVNKYLQELLEVVVDESDPWILFLKAIFLKRLSRKEEAVEATLLSIRGCPWNWSAWCLLASCIGDRDELGAILTLIDLPQGHPLIDFFKMKVIVALHSPVDEDLSTCDRWLAPENFPHSSWLMSLRAVTLYHLHDFHRAEIQFEHILKLDPLRVDDIDVLSNILYVTENRVKLSKLAHHFLSVDKDRPEVCCMVGNHYSLRREPERAIQYFRRATELDQSYLPAWTLMGHEYVEIKNSHAAIECYRRAIDVDRKDYRAWYGLGQAYELLNMHQYAMHYYQRATALRPYDVRVWEAQGMCYEEMNRHREAIECYKRALLGSDTSSIHIPTRLAKLYDEVEDSASAAAYHQQIIDASLLTQRPVFMFARSLLYVAKHILEKHEKNVSGQGSGVGAQIDVEDVKKAVGYAEKVAQSNAEEVGAATDLLKRMATVLGVGVGDRMEGEVPQDSTTDETQSPLRGESDVPPGTAS